MYHENGFQPKRLRTCTLLVHTNADRKLIYTNTAVLCPTLCPGHGRFGQKENAACSVRPLPSTYFTHDFATCFTLLRSLLDADFTPAYFTLYFAPYFTPTSRPVSLPTYLTRLHPEFTTFLHASVTLLHSLLQQCSTTYFFSTSLHTSLLLHSLLQSVLHPLLHFLLRFLLHSTLR